MTHDLISKQHNQFKSYDSRDFIIQITGLDNVTLTNLDPKI